MMFLLAALLLPMHFTAPADTLGVEASGRARVSKSPVHAYVFHKLDAEGAMVTIPGYADAAGRGLLLPHAPGTRETVWLSPCEVGSQATVFVMSRDRNGNMSAPSNGCVLGARDLPEALALRRGVWTALDVPVVKQARERCGQAALVMVLRYYGAPPAALREAESAYDPVLRGSLITDLAAAARRAGYEASVVELTPDSLIDLLNDGVPPILLYQRGSGPVTLRHFGVVTGWDAAHTSFRLNDGGSRARTAPRAELAQQWQTAGSLALVVRQRLP